jgi:hypothetical protein
MCRKTSNARSATAKAQEEAGKANDSLLHTWRGSSVWSNPDNPDT